MGAWPIALEASQLIQRYRAVRSLTTELCQKLSDADATVQSMEDASPAKWHLAHTTWFFETFILRDHVSGYCAFNDEYAFLFNSYYEAEGARHARPQRGLITRPSLNEILEYRLAVDDAIINAAGGLGLAALELLELGLHHEQQHQELLLTDIKHLFAQNPLRPAIWESDDAPRSSGFSTSEDGKALNWISGQSGIIEIGHAKNNGFAFDCEGPRHQELLHPFAIANRTVTNGEWLQFMQDGGYRDPRFWLSDGWAWVQQYEIASPLYWREDKDGCWYDFGFTGEEALDLSAPATHISLYEADAFASWASGQWSGARLPTEVEWESMATRLDAASGNQLQCAGSIRPMASGASSSSADNSDGSASLLDYYGNVWEWTGSAFRPYPGFTAADGAVGEYNGKFMSGQFVLKGGSCATPRGHMRASYRNFFHPHQRWQFTGLRLARNV